MSANLSTSLSVLAISLASVLAAGLTLAPPERAHHQAAGAGAPIPRPAAQPAHVATVAVRTIRIAENTAPPRANRFAFDRTEGFKLAVAERASKAQAAVIARWSPNRPLIQPFAVPTPRHVRRKDFAHLFRVPLKQPRTTLVSLSSAPFPYNGRVPGTGEAFLNASTEGRLAHRTRGGRLYTADETYSDNRSLFHIPKGFDITQPGVIVLFFHGHGAMLKRDVWERQRLPAQITASGVNAVLLAPQFAVDARDSSIGRFWQPGALRQYLNDAARQFAALYGEPGTEAEFARMPIVVVGYSGGYMPAAWGLAHGGVRDRVSGVLLLDAMYGHQASFFNFIRRSPSAFFVSSYGRYTRNGNDSLRRVLADVGIDAAPSLPSVLRGGSVALIEATVSHRDYVTNAWAPMPVADVLRRMPGVGRIAAPGRVASRR